MEILDIPISKITSPPYQPRSQSEIAGLESLASSIKELGLLQPIVVRAINNGYQLIAGSRRIAACKMLGWDIIPARNIDASNADATLMSVTENLAREDLNPLEVARAIHYMLTELQLSRAEIANTFGHQTDWVSAQLKLLEMPEYLQEAVSTAQLSKGAALTLNRIPDEEIKEMYTAYGVKGGCTERTAGEWLRQATASVAARERRHEIGAITPFEPPEPLPAIETPRCWICQAPGDKVNLETIPLCWHCQQALKQA